MKKLKKLSFITILCLSVFVFSCKTKEPANKAVNEKGTIENNNMTGTSDDTKNQQRDRDVIVEQGFLPEGKNNRMNILSASLSKDILNLVISYSGGCKEHDFNLYYNGLFAKSLPPQIKLHLIDSQEEDMCRQLITDTLNFNVAKVKVENTNKVILTINEYEERLEYIY